ncbi:MAG: DUF1648 domain-containing protein [Gemmatimonadota bacterium]
MPTPGERARRRARLVTVLSLAALGAYGIVGYLTMPERPATHFALDGTPDGWMERGGFLVFMAVLVVGLNLLLPALLRLGPSALNVPHKAWWLETPARRQEMLRRGGVLMDLTLAYMNLVFLLAMHVVLQSNGAPVPIRLPGQVVLPLILLGTVVYVVGLLRYTQRLFAPEADLFP